MIGTHLNLAVCACSATLLLAACTGPGISPGSQRTTGPQTNKAPRTAFVPYIPGLSTNQEIRLMTPKTVREDYTFPEKSCRQSFQVFGDGDMTWNIEFPRGIASHGAIVFKRSNDLSGFRSTGVLRIRMKPGTAASQLRVGIVDDRGVLADVPMAVPHPGADSSWRVIEVPLHSFPERGIATGEDAGTIATFDWSAVGELRLISDGRLAEPVAVSLLRIWKEQTP